MPCASEPLLPVPSTSEQSKPSVLLLTTRPVPSRLMSESSPRFRYVVEAVVKEEYVEEAYGKVEAEVVVAVKVPARALIPKSDEPYTERALQGVVVPMPSQPVEVKVEVAVEPKYELLKAESWVVEAWPKNCMREVVAD